MLREPKIEIPQMPEQPSNWHSLTCELITPMYGGGVESTKVDKKMPIRASSIRGGLRFWWRLLAKHKWKIKDIAKYESDIWGSVGKNDDDGKAGKVLLKIKQQPQINDSHLIAYTELNGLNYVLFPATNETDPSKIPHRLLRANNISFQLEFLFVDMNENQQNQVIETLQWWANFGGLGFRSRKGLGAIVVTAIHAGCQDEKMRQNFEKIRQNLTADEVKQAGCQLIVRNGNNPNAINVLAQGIQRLSNFRQGVGIGRNVGQQANRPGRSRFPEPDALRRIQKNLGYDRRHEPEHKAGNIFPRAVFGLPILFHSHQENAVNATVNPSIGERLASPLIIRPRKVGNGYQAIALALPYQDILTMNVVVNNTEYPIWQDDTAEHITPIRENGGGDPIQAFLNYFAG